MTHKGVDFVRELKASGIEHVIMRPTGCFSDTGEFFRMAQSGPVFLVGSGENHINPIHGADLARVCVEVHRPQGEINVGGPEVVTYRDIARTAFAVLGKEDLLPSGLVDQNDRFNHQGSSAGFG